MTELWSFSEKQMMGGEHKGSESESESENRIIGGLSVSQFFCKNKPSKDSETYPFFESFIVPHGLVFTRCDSYEDYHETEESDEDHHSMCPSFDKLFFLAAKDLGKSRSDKTKTRKKIPR